MDMERRAVRVDTGIEKACGGMEAARGADDGTMLWLARFGLGALLVGECAFLLYVSIAGVFQVPIVIGTEGPCTASDFPGKHVGEFS